MTSRLKFTQFMIRETPPLRLVVDVEGIELTPGFRDLVAKVEPNDPYIGLIRVGQNRPKVVRLVIELKEDIKPQVFALEPVGPYQHRLLLDLYPVSPPDPLMALLREQSTPRDSDFGSVPPVASDRTTAQATTRPTRRNSDNDVQRIVTVAIDPGHGGEDPGAVGRARHLREERHAVDRAPTARADRRRFQHARRADSRRRLLRAAAHARREGACRAGRSAGLGPRGCVDQARCARLIGVRAVGKRRNRAARPPGWLVARTTPTSIGGINLGVA